MTEKLAIRGGTPVIEKGAHKAYPIITDDDKAAVMGVLDSGTLWGNHSPQVKGLEKQLGRRLFRRMSRGLALTDDAQALLPVLQGSFDRIADAVARITARAQQGALEVPGSRCWPVLAERRRVLLHQLRQP